MTVRRIDLNCDLGEGGASDAELLRHVTSANVACGFHAGDPATMRRTVAMAAARGVAVGAHPGLPDRAGFGRGSGPIDPADAYDLVLYQTGALRAFTTVAGIALRHVKPHGALYNQAATDPELADAVARAVRDAGDGLQLYALAGSRLVAAAEAVGVPVASEAFADRGYLADGTLVPRGSDGALLSDPDAAVRRALRLVTDGVMETADGGEIALRADTLCVHGDAPGAAQLAARLRAALEGAGVEVRAPGHGLARR